jgi:DeoR/GlpR family transcriptional regulator of sugar metabolism
MKVAYEVVKARRDQLAGLLQKHQYLPLSEVCERLKISEATARRDLAVLERERAITRTYGGALCEFNQRFPSFRERQQSAPVAKRRIAKAALALIAPRSVCYLDGGTTVFALAQLIVEARHLRPLTVVTNSLPVAEALSEVDGIEINLLGGHYLRRQSLMLGGKSEEHVRGWSFAVAFLGAEAMSADGLWNSQAEVIGIQRAVMEATPRVCFCVDASKIGARASDLLLPWAQVDRLATDATPRQLSAAGIALGRGQLIPA